MRADAERRSRLEELHRSEEQRLPVKVVSRPETQTIRELLTQLERMQLIHHLASNLQVNQVLSQIVNPYPSKDSPPLPAGRPWAHHFRPMDSRDVAVDLSPVARAVCSLSGSSGRLDHGMVGSHMSMGGAVGSPRVLAGEAHDGRK